MKTGTPRPIDGKMIFSEDSVRAILGGQKTQTRRVLKNKPFGQFTGLKTSFHERLEGNVSLCRFGSYSPAEEQAAFIEQSEVVG